MVKCDAGLVYLSVSEPARRVAQLPHPVNVSGQLIFPQTQRLGQLGARQTGAQVTEFLGLILTKVNRCNFENTILSALPGESSYMRSHLMVSCTGHH